jgi:hypothetical protein
VAALLVGVAEALVCVEVFEGGFGELGEVFAGDVQVSDAGGHAGCFVGSFDGFGGGLGGFVGGHVGLPGVEELGDAAGGFEVGSWGASGNGGGEDGGGFALADVGIADVERGGEGVIAAEDGVAGAGGPGGVVVRGAVLEEGGGAEIDAGGDVFGGFGEAGVGAGGESEDVGAVAFDEGVGIGGGGGGECAGEGGGGGGAHDLEGGGEEELAVPEDGGGAGLGVEVLHAVVEVRVGEAGAGAVHGGGGRGGDVDDRELLCHEARAVGGFAFGVLGHEVEGVAVLAEEDVDDAVGDDDGAAADGDEEVRADLAGGIGSGGGGAVGGVDLDSVEGAGVAVAEGFGDAIDGVGFGGDGGGADDEGASRSGTRYLGGELALDGVGCGVEAPLVGAGGEGVAGVALILGGWGGHRRMVARGWGVGRTSLDAELTDTALWDGHRRPGTQVRLPASRVCWHPGRRYAGHLLWNLEWRQIIQSGASERIHSR